MRVLYWAMLGAIGVTAVVVSIMLDPISPARGQGPVGPPAALAQMREGRFLAATRTIRQSLSGQRDTSAASILLLARAEAGWGHWSAVEALLAGRMWLERAQEGAGLELLGRARLARGAWSAAAADLGRYLQVASALDDRQRGLTLARQARALRRAGQEEAALRAYDEAARRLEGAGQWVRLEAVGAAAAAGDTAQVRTRLAALPPALAREHGWELRLRAATRARDTAAALAVAREAQSTLSGGEARAEAAVAEGMLRRAQHDRAGARAAFDRALQADPEYAPAARALLGLSGLSPEQKLRAATALLAAGEPARAAAPLRSYLATARVPPARRSALLLQLGRSLFFAGHYDDAMGALRAAAKRADAGTASQALYYLGRAQVRSGSARSARSTLSRLVELYPRRSAAASAIFLLGDLAQDAGRPASARAYFREVVEYSAPASTVGEAYMRLAEMAFTARDYAAAARACETYRKRFPAGEYHSQATYWAARSYLRLGRTSLAHARLEELLARGTLSYYSVRAAHLLQRPPLASFMATAVPQSGMPDPQAVAGTEAVAVLSELGLDDAEAAEIRALQARFAGKSAALYDLAEALQAAGFSAASIRIGLALRARGESWNPRLLRMVYPLPYRAAIAAAARARGLDPYLVAGLIRQESSFKADARSRVGAIGLMQLMPGTGRSLARALGLPSVQAGVLDDPEVNVQLGTTFVADLLRQTRGNVAEMLAAYNAGPARLDGWRRFPERRDPELFAERIPFDETREYVKVVQANASIYRALYPGLEATAGA